MLLKPKTAGYRRGAVILCLVALLVVSLGCLPLGRGTNQVDLFGEMHYSQAYRSQQPPRLYPASGGVTFQSAGSVSANVTKESRSGYTGDGSVDLTYLYHVNCQVCHGISGTGDGPMKAFLAKWKGMPPANFVVASATSTDEEIFAYISEGGRAGYVASQAGVESPSPMPSFKKLLSEDDRWALVEHVRQLQGK